MAGISGLAGAGMSAAASEVAQGNMSHGVVRANMINMNKYDAAMANNQGRTDTWKYDSQLSNDRKMSHDTANSDVSSYKKYNETDTRDKYRNGLEVVDNNSINTQDQFIDGTYKEYKNFESSTIGSEDITKHNKFTEKRKENLVTITDTYKEGTTSEYAGSNQVNFTSGAVADGTANKVAHANYGTYRALNEQAQEARINGNHDLADELEKQAKAEKARVDKTEKTAWLNARMDLVEKGLQKQVQNGMEEAEQYRKDIQNSSDFMSKLSKTDGWDSMTSVQRVFGFKASLGISTPGGKLPLGFSASAGGDYSYTRTDGTTVKVGEMSSQDLAEASREMKAYAESFTYKGGESLNINDIRAKLSTEFDNMVKDREIDTGNIELTNTEARLEKVAPITPEGQKAYVNKYEDDMRFQQWQNEKHFHQRPQHKQPDKINVTGEGKRNITMIGG